MVWTTPSDLQRVVATLCYSNPGAIFFHLHDPHQCGIWKVYRTLANCRFYCNTHLWCAHLMVALKLNACLTFTTCCSLEANARVATYQPWWSPINILPLAFWSPCFVMGPAIWDLLTLGPFRGEDGHYSVKSVRLKPLKVVPTTNPPPCSTNYCFKQKGEHRGKEGGVLHASREMLKHPPSYFSS